MPSATRLLVYEPLPETAGSPGSPLDAARRLGFAHATRARARLAVPSESGPVVAELPVAAVALPDALPALLAGPEAALPPWRRPPDSLRAFSELARLAVDAVARRLLAPDLVRTADGRVLGTWRSLVDTDPAARAAAERLAEALPPAAHAVATGQASVATPQAVVAQFLDAVADVCARSGNGEAVGPSRRPRARLLPWTARWLEALRDPEDPEVPLGSDADELLAGVASWHARDAVAHLELTLDAPPGDGPWRLAFALRDDGGRVLPAAEVWSGTGAAEGDAVQLQEALLEGLGRCARVFPPLDAALVAEAPAWLDLDLAGAWLFLRDAAPLLAAAGVAVTVPEEVTDEALALRLRVGAPGELPTDATAGPDVDTAAAGDGEAQVRWEVTLDGEALDPGQLRALLDDGRPLLRVGDRWVRVDPELRRHVDALSGVRIAPGEGLLYGLAGSVPLGTLTGDGAAGAGPRVDVVCDGRMAALVGRLRETAERPDPVPSPPGFHGELRPYQQRGVAWLAGMGRLGLGAVLADAMGLGKTIELIGHLLSRPGDGPHLVVCPTSVVGNWEREIARFAPGIEVTRFHGPERPGDLDGVRGVVVTSYGLLRRDPGPLVAVDWDVVTLDEAQHVKNPQTAGARAARRLRSRQTVAMTGTPLENRLAELWSVLDVTNPGLLGSRARFGRRFVAPIEQRQDPGASARLRRVVAPFVLRREKRDVLDDLPDKIEREVACTLTAEQSALYAQAVERTIGAGDLDGASAMQRRGRVLALLTALKQICNHPAQYLREQPGTDLVGRSGKLAVTREIIAEAVAAGDRVLLFTQFVEMGKLLVAQLSGDLDHEVPLLHGGVAAPARDRMVDAFQSSATDAPPVLAVSLRAGGTGLNLTAATHVVHYDRWWNPAVEDQATDRAHRIGQRRTVEVHKLVTAGTVEERISALLERKRALADAVVGAGEQWVTELSDAELRELVALGAPGEELDEDDPFARERWEEPEPLEEAG